MTTTKTKFKTISQEITGGEGTQTVTFLEYLTAKTKTGTEAKIRVYLKTDSYKSQSHASADIWDGNRWNQISRIQPKAMSTDASLGYKRNAPTAADFDRDRDHLLTVAAQILA